MRTQAIPVHGYTVDGKKLKRLRLAKHWKQRDLAAHILAHGGFDGMSFESAYVLIARLEAPRMKDGRAGGNSKKRFQRFVECMAEELDVTVADLAQENTADQVERFSADFEQKVEAIEDRRKEFVPTAPSRHGYYIAKEFEVVGYVYHVYVGDRRVTVDGFVDQVDAVYLAEKLNTLP